MEHTHPALTLKLEAACTFETAADLSTSTQCKDRRVELTSIEGFSAETGCLQFWAKFGSTVFHKQDGTICAQDRMISHAVTMKMEPHHGVVLHELHEFCSLSRSLLN